ncbi:Alpha-glucuronidase [Actinomadura madurae]|nr:Alpha-glucuronidase [Actinomadura madurae]
MWRMPDKGRARRRWFSVAGVVLLVLGGLVAGQVDAALGLRTAPAGVPAERMVAGTAAPAAGPPDLTSIVLPADGPDLDRRRERLAAEAVAAALAGRGRPRPQVGTVRKGTALRVEKAASLAAPAGEEDEAFRLRKRDGGLLLQASTSAGAANGLYAIADRIRSGAEVLPDDQDGRVVAPALPLRLIDHGSVGLTADEPAFAKGDDYGLNTDVVGPAVLKRAPWVDASAAAAIGHQFRQFVDHALADGYNGVVVPGYLEYVTFSGVGDGHAVYREGDPHIARAQAMRAAFGPSWKYAHDMGMKVFFQTDMLALSPPLEKYLGDLDTSSARLWSVYRAGLHELFTTMPYVDGLVVRIGEGGEDYKFAGWDYRSEIKVTTVEQVRAMLTAFLRQAGADGRDIVFRTWSVGVGAVGDMHTDPASYHEVLDGIDDEHLIVSTKYTLGDFYSHLPLNTTLLTGKQKRIVEFQSRREFEGFGALPNNLGGLHQQALRTFLAKNPNIVGLWNWTQDGGPLRAGPMTLYLRTGFWQMWDVNVYLTARLAWDPDLDVAKATNDWIRRTFSDDPETVSAIAQVMALSRTAVGKGLYIGPYADTTVKALGLEPPPMMWIFEWDIVTGDSAALDTIYRVARPRLEEAIGEGEDAVGLARRMRALIDGTEAESWRDPALRQRFADTMAYQVDLFGTLAAYRTMVLRHAQWLDTGSASARTAWRAAEKRFKTAAAAHVRRYGGNTALPAYNFTAAEIGMKRADRDEAMAWFARTLLAGLAVVFVLGGSLGQRLLRGAPGSAAFRGLWLGLTRPWRVASVEPAGRLDRVLVWLVPAAVLVLSRAVYTWFAAPAHLVLVLGAWLAFALALRWLTRGSDRFALSAAIGGVALGRTVILLVALAGRGPGRYWYDFWTEPGLRSLYITVAFAAFCWTFAIAYRVLRDAYGLSVRRATGVTLIGAGAPPAALGSLVAAIGLEDAMTMWNDQLALLPWGLSRILGITTYLGIPAALPAITAGAGVVLVASGALLAGRTAARAERA